MKKPKNIVLGFAILVFLVFGIIIISKPNPNPEQTTIKSDTQNNTADYNTNTNPPLKPTTPQLPNPNTQTKYYSLAEIAKHNKPSDCWTAVSGSVYNVTSWISEHPGGSEAIIYMCGIDASSAFIDQHSGEKRPAKELSAFKIGIFK